MRILAALLLFPSLAMAASWHLIFDQRGHRVFVDRASLHRDGAMIRATLRYEYAGVVPARNGWPAYRSSIEVRRFDCAAGASGVEQSVIFAMPEAAGKPLQALRMRDVAMEIPQPGTLGATITAAVCGLKAT